MDDNRIFGQTIDAAARALDLRSRRHEMIISNIANADTPGYKAFDLMVDEALQKTSANSSNSSSDSVSMLRTHAGHLPPKATPHQYLNVRVIEPETKASLRGDGNTVDMDREMSNLASNQVLYKATAQILAKKFEGLMNAIKGGKS